ncbi:MAG: tetratricopeptide repeat protein [SAR324 cluster bacterium]|nr:tetratricopeptide repeat protein [SAR324 cluster bacterium]
MFSFKSRQNIFGILILFSIAFLAYLPAVDAEFAMDDADFYADDPVMADSAGLLRIWLHPFDNNDAWPYLPVTRTTFWLENQLWGRKSQITHGINIVLHLLSALILWQMLRQFSVRGALLTAMLFAIHPIQVQSVAWASERKNVVAGIFFLLALWSYLYFIKKKRHHWYLFSFGFFICALLSKTSTIMLPIVFIFAHFCFDKKWKHSNFLLLTPFLIMSAGKGYLRIWFEIHSFKAMAESYDLSLLDRIIIAGHIPFFYLKKIVFPHPLIFTYPKWQIDASQFAMYLPVVSLALIAIILLWTYRSWGQYLFLLLGSFLVMLFPVLGFFNNSWFQFSFVADHWIHLPSIFVFILLVQGCIAFSEFVESHSRIHLRAQKKIIFVGLFAGLGFLTWKQTQIYKNNKTLWTQTIMDNPKSWIAFQELGRLYAHSGKLDHALNYSNKALELNKNLPLAYNNRGTVLFKLKKYNQAIEDFDQAILLIPNFGEAFYNRGLSYFNRNQYKQALNDFDQAIQLKPGQAVIYLHRANTFSILNKPFEALEDFRRSLTLNPDQPELYFNLGLLYSELGNFEEAIASYSKSIEFDQNTENAYYFRGNAFHKINQFENAIQDYSHVIRRNPDAVSAFNNRGVIYAVQVKNMKLACQDWEKACKLGSCQNYRLAEQKKDCP